MQVLPQTIVSQIQNLTINELTFENISETRRKVIATAKDIWNDVRCREQLNNSWSKVMKVAWNKVKLELAARMGIVYFCFARITENDSQAAGEKRFAMATLKADLFDYEFKGSTSYKNPLVFKFVDTMLGKFRSCRVETIQEVFWVAKDEL